MFCSNCGKENEIGSKFCKYCGEEIREEVKIDEDSKVESADENESLKVNSILSLVFSIILAPVGLVLSIIGFNKCDKYKKKSGKNSPYFGLNIAGLIISIIEIFILFIVGIVYVSFSMQDNNLKGTWNCTSGRYLRIVKFDNNKFEWFVDGTKNNGIIGDYNIVKREYTNGKSVYDIVLNVKSTVINGKESSYFKTNKIQMKFDKNNAVIGSYVCTKAY